MVTTVDEKTIESMEATYYGYWAQHKKLKLPTGDFTFADHEYLADPMNEDYPVEVEKKATQMGGSIKTVIWCFHKCIYGFFPQGIGYVMPNDTEVQKFSKTKFAPMIQYNPGTIGKYVKAGGKGTDSADLKKVGHSFIHFCSATPNKTVQGERTSSVATSFSADALVFDEVDMMDADVIAKFLSRMDHSKFKWQRYLSNPTGENYGIDAMFQDSDQRYWHRLCPNCLSYTCPDLEFIKNPENLIGQDAEGNGVILCVHCRKPIPLFYFDPKTKKRSMWIPLYKDRQTVGRQYSHLNSAFHDPYVLLQMLHDPEKYRLTLKEVMRNQFGLAYTSKEDQLRSADVYACCGPEPMRMSHEGPCIAAVDVMNKIHALFGIKTGRDRYELIRAMKCDSFAELGDWFKKLNVKVAGVDIAPDLHAAKEFQKAMKTYGCKVYLVDYRTSRHVGPVDFDEVNGIIKANRTEAMDMSHKAIVDRKIQIFRREQAEEFVKQVCNPFKIEVKNEKTGIPEYRYIGKQDHYRHGLNYFLLAGMKSRVVKSDYNVYGGYNENSDCIMNYSAI